jgi:hypothetical protein
VNTSEIISLAMTALARRRAAKLTPNQRKQIAAAGGKSSWAGMTPEQRSAEMKRRARVRNQNRARKSKL